MKIGNKTFQIEITFSKLSRLAASRGIPMSQVFQWLSTMTYADMVDLVVVSDVKGELTHDYFDKEVDNDAALIGELANEISTQLGSKQGDSKKKEVVKR